MKQFWARFRPRWNIRIKDPRILLAIILAYGFSRTSGGHFPHLLLFTFSGLAVLSAAWVLYLTPQIRVVYETNTKSLTRGEDLPVILLVYNEGFLPALRLEIRDASQPERSHHCQLPALASLRLAYRVPQLKRGRYHPGPVVISITDPFGFFQKERTVTSSRPITVYPPVHRWDLELPLAQSFGQTRTRRRSTTDPSSLVGIREFRFGDNTKHIDWKASARHRQLQVKEFELEATGFLSLYVNLTASDYSSSDQVEKAIDATAALAVHALKQGSELRLFAQGKATHYLPPVRGTMGIRGCLELLVDMGTASSGSFAQVLHGELAHTPPESSILLITPALDAAAKEMVRQSCRRGRSLTLIWLGDEVPEGMLYENLLIYQVDDQIRPHRIWKGGLVHATSLR